MVDYVSACEAVARFALHNRSDAKLNATLKTFVTGQIKGAKNLEQLTAAYGILGEALIRDSLFAVQKETELRKLLAKADKYIPSIESWTENQVRLRLIDLAAGRVAPTAKPDKPPARLRPGEPGTKQTDLPDVRSIYRSGSLEDVYAALKGLTPKALRSIITDQSLSASDERKGDKKADLLKYIQIALKSEVGRRGDPIGVMAASLSENEE